MKIHQIIFNPTGGTQRVSEILLFLLLTFFLAYIQTTEVKGQSSYFSYGASIMNGELYCGHQEDSAFAMHSVMKFPQALYVADYLHKKFKYGIPVIIILQVALAVYLLTNFE